MGTAIPATPPKALPTVITPTEDYSRTTHRTPDKLLKGLDASVHSLIGFYRRRSQVLTGLAQEAEKIEALAGTYRELTDHNLRLRLREFRNKLRRSGRDRDSVVAPALAAIREAAERRTGLRPFHVQLIGALALYRGYLAEMATGEGKTLTAGLAAVLSGWTRKPCHIITVNDYLVQRDREWLIELYHFCGVKVGCVTAAMPPEERKKGYDCDVTYTTSKEVVADFLRDGLQIKALKDPTRRLIRRMLAPRRAVQDGLVMRGLHTAIVDEADSILIDEAVVPLIIARPRKNESLREVVELAQQIAGPLTNGDDYRVNTRYREVEFTNTGLNRIESSCSSIPGLWRGKERRSELLKQAIIAREFYELSK